MSKIEEHQECPYNCTCNKDLTKCCYLVRNKCIMNEFEEKYLLEILNKK